MIDCLSDVNSPSLNFTVAHKKKRTRNMGRENEFWFWRFFFEALVEFPSYLIQSKASTSPHEYSESNCTNKYVMLLSNIWGEHRGLSQFSEAGWRHQLVLVPPHPLPDITISSFIFVARSQDFFGSKGEVGAGIKEPNYWTNTRLFFFQLWTIWWIPTGHFKLLWCILWEDGYWKQT